MWLLPWTMLGLLLYGGGLYLIRRLIWRGEEAPLCAACGYDIRGRNELERCPECGVSLSKGNVVAASSSHGRRPIHLLANLMIVLGSFIIGIVGLFALGALLRA